jgi:hypothetical protein
MLSDTWNKEEPEGKKVLVHSWEAGQTGAF